MLNEKNRNEIISLCNSEDITVITNLYNDNLNMRERINLKCNKCNSDININIKNLLDPRRAGLVCQKCFKINSYFDLLKKKYGRIPYKFLTELTGDRSQEIEVECIDCGERTFTTLSRTLMNSKLSDNNHPCKKCSFIRNYKKDQSTFYSELENKFGKCNYTLLTPEKFTGFNATNKLKMKCNICGYEFETYPANVFNPKNGKHYCRVCNHKDRLLEKMTYKERCLSVTEGRIEPIDEYIDSKTPIKHKCNICGLGISDTWLKIPVKNTLRNAGCPRCSNNITTSKAEEEIVKFIKSIYDGPIEIHNRNILNGKEIDIYLPNKNIAIEFNGIYYHSTKFKEKDYHQKKALSLLSKNIALLSIFEDDWVIDRNHVFNTIKDTIFYVPGENLDNIISLNNTISIKNLDISNYKVLEPESKKFLRKSNNYKIFFYEDEDDEFIEVYDCGKVILK